jgi:uncharacterized Fe-S cluster protein YjdI
MDGQEKIIKYSNDELTVVWKPAMCIHSKHCWKELPEVFKPKDRPWVDMKGASSEKIKEQVDKCPSGALSYIKKGEQPETKNNEWTSLIEVTRNGPLLVHGNVTIQDAEGKHTERQKVTALCRCGDSANKPYCDGSHSKKGFVG